MEEKQTGIRMLNYRTRQFIRGANIALDAKAGTLKEQMAKLDALNYWLGAISAILYIEKLSEELEQALDVMMKLIRKEIRTIRILVKNPYISSSRLAKLKDSSVSNMALAG